jgi:hypothetical protein
LGIGGRAAMPSGSPYMILNASSKRVLPKNEIKMLKIKPKHADWNRAVQKSLA